MPQHVTALLSHLTSRPGVQSTLILARKDGSIIQSTGLLAVQEPSTSRQTPPASSTTETNPLAQSVEPSPASPAPFTSHSTYQPSQAEALAAHIFNFVSSASALGISLSKPITRQSGDAPNSSGLDGAYGNYANGIRNSQEEREADTGDRDEDDEVKLLRMRTKKHEIVVVPDKKYLLCVVHDAAGATSGPGGAGARSAR